MRPRALIVLLVLLAAVPAAAEEPALADALNGTCQTPLRFGVSPYLDRNLLLAAYRPFADYLARELGMPVELVVPERYADMRAMLRDGRLDLAYLTPLLYIQARRDDPGLRLLGADVWQGVSFYTGYLVVRSDSGLTSPTDLAGRRLALVDPQSASGWLLPRHELRARGLPVEGSSFEVVLSGDHTRALQMLLDGRVDAAAVSSNTLAMARRDGLDGGRVRILMKTGTIPPDVLCAASRLPDDLLARLTDLVQGIDTRSPLGRSVIPRATRLNGWRPGDPREYDVIERLMLEEESRP